ncbi:AAA family ATPase [Ornithinimicrobium cavernae]|uniref:AAA family ATPase n=1 Tax=Ornithinimicrobium cavernae TaxID=2666047 RepID=UPI001379DFD2|nr:AAA family ATPase [Ornithinimicrobium cavernae]
MTELGPANPEQAIRRPLLVRRLFDVLLEASKPVPASDALKRVAELEPLTPHETSTTASGESRANNLLRFTSSWARAIGWLRKSAEGWELTSSGREALAALSDDDNLYSLLTKKYRQVQRSRRDVSSDAAENEKVATLNRALDLVEEGQWTAYSDLAELTTLANQNVGTFAKDTDHPNGHRVLHADGQVSASFEWRDPERTDDPRDVLEAEGVEFDVRGRARQAQRLTSHDFRDMLAELSGEEREPRAWMVRGSSVNGKNLVPTWLAKGTCSIPASQIRSLPLPITRSEISAIVEEDYSQKSYTTRTEKVAEIDAFVNRLRVGDLVATNSGPDLFIGTITGDPVALKSSDDRSNVRRTVEWHNIQKPIDYSGIPKTVSAKLSSQHTIVDLTSDLAALRSLLDHNTMPSSSDRPLPASVEELSLPPISTDLADDLLVDTRWLQSCVHLLEDRRQLIFYGPPGTGKTYLAQAIAKHLTAPEASKLVQFHPAYSYEDFFEGFRPVAGVDGSGAIGFKLTPGPFRRLVDAARENPATPYILIIDEINRANLAKVFGELYFLLEYRDSAIDLLYSSGDDQGFTMPQNVFIIGTMNTADRSIALVDTAMRRRFAFKALHPSTEPTRSMLSKWLVKKGLPQTAAKVMDHLNGLIEDEDFKIGPSYFMRKSVHEGDGMSVVWETSILPLLEEHHFGEGRDVSKDYSLSRILKKVEGAAAEVSDGATDPADADVPATVNADE